MRGKRAKIFVSHYPPDIEMYAPFAKMAKVKEPKTEIILFRVAHPYRFNLSPYNKYFDKIVEFPHIKYDKNIISGIHAIRSFKKAWRRSILNLQQYAHIDVYIEDSYWLPVTAFLYVFAKIKQVKHIYRITLGDNTIKGARIDYLRTLFIFFYYPFIPTYAVKAMRRNNGGFVTFSSLHKLPGTTVRLLKPTAKSYISLTEMGIPYPLFVSRTEKKIHDMVIIFGDKGVLEDFSDYVDKKNAESVLHEFFKALETHYRGVPIYYKAHPGAPDVLLPGMIKSHYRFLPAEVSAQFLLKKYYLHIKAAYTFFSTSVMWSSFFGIPSYTLYRLVYNKEGRKRLDATFGQQDIASPLIFPLGDIHDIGKIDNKKINPPRINIHNLLPPYTSLLH